MGRLVLLALLIAAAPLSAELVTEYQDDVLLRDHETVRYRVDIDYGTATEADVDVVVRGFTAPPRVRILNEDRREVKEVEDTDGDWTIEPGFTAKDSNATYYIEVDSANPGWEADFEVTISVHAPASAAADADVAFERYYFDHESGDASDHYECSTGTGTDGWPLIGVALAALGTVYLRRRSA
jgi:LPXTG-motif cell wall-anchored protein